MFCFPSLTSRFIWGHSFFYFVIPRCTPASIAPAFHLAPYTRSEWARTTISQGYSSPCPPGRVCTGFRTRDSIKMKRTIILEFICRANCQSRFGPTRPRPRLAVRSRPINCCRGRIYLPCLDGRLISSFSFFFFILLDLLASASEWLILDGDGKELVNPPTSSISSNAVNVSSIAGQRVNEQSCSGEDRGGCEHVCSQSAEPDSIRCLCYRGFRLNADGKSCVGTSPPSAHLQTQFYCPIALFYFYFGSHPESSSETFTLFTDVDECATANGGCDGQCSNRPGSFICSCPVGFRLASNGKKCIGTDIFFLNLGAG